MERQAVQWLTQQQYEQNALTALENTLLVLNQRFTRSFAAKVYRDTVKTPSPDVAQLQLFLDYWQLTYSPLTESLRNLGQAAMPILACIQEGHALLWVVIISATEEHVQFIDSRMGVREMTLLDFSQYWMAKALQVQVGPQSKEQPDYTKAKHEETQTREHKKEGLVWEVPDLLNAEECQHIITLAEPQMGQSAVFGYEQVQLFAGRTSSSALLAENEDDPVVKAIKQRVAAQINQPLANMEPLQCVRYYPLQEYQPHYDTIDANTEIGQQEVAQQGQRAYTVLIYLNNDFEGGYTYFPTLDLRIEPALGKALVFKSLNADGTINPDSLHAGLPVISGTKYAANLWISNKALK